VTSIFQNSFHGIFAMQAKVRFYAVGLVLLGLLLLSGCSGETRAGNELSGRIVTNKGTALGGGQIQLCLEGNGTPVANAFIQSDGTYRITDLVPGKYVVTIETESVKNVNTKREYNMQGMMKRKPKEKLPGEKMPTFGEPADTSAPNFAYVKIHPKYANVQTSTLKLEFTGGRQTHDFTVDEP
jgi:hypothetical protein